MSKEPCDTPKEPCDMPKEPTNTVDVYNSVVCDSVAHVHSRLPKEPNDTSNVSKELYNASKEPYNMSKEPCNMSKEPYHVKRAL